MWSSNFSVEVVVKFRVLLAVPRNEARKSLRMPASCLVLTCAFDAKMLIEKESGRFKISKVTCTLLYLHLYSWVYICSHQSP